MKERINLFGPRYRAEQLPYGYFVEPPDGDRERGVVWLRSGGLLIGWNISGPPFESAAAADVAAACNQFSSSLGLMETGDCLTVRIDRVKAPDYPTREFQIKGADLIDRDRAGFIRAGNCYRNMAQVWWATQFERTVPNLLKSLFFASTEHQMLGSRELQMQRFLHRAEKWEDMVGSVFRPRRMSQLELYRSLVLAVNGTHYPAPLPPRGAALHRYLAQQDLIGGSKPRLGRLHVRVITLVPPWPEYTTEQMLSVALSFPGEMTLACRFIALDQTDAQAALELERKHRVREAAGTGVKQWLATAFNLPRRASTNQDIEDQIKEIDHVRALVAKGTALGFGTITIEVKGEDEEQVHSGARQIVRDYNDLGQGARIEDANAVAALLGGLPANGIDNVRRPLTLASNFAEQSMLVGHWEGTPTIDSPLSEKDTPVPLICIGSGGEPFYVPLHIRGVGHQLLIGPTGTGKSVYLAALVAALMVLRKVRILLLDRGYSSFVLTQALGGTYVELATDNSSPLCPFQWIERDDGITWLFDWFSRLFARWLDNLVNAREAAELTEALTIAKATGVRTMTAFRYLLHAPRLRQIMANYADGGQWAHIFDGEPVPGKRPTLTTYEMRHLDALGERATAPATELIVHDAEAGLGADPTFVLIDEAKWILASPISLPWIDRALRTFRRANGALILCTQSLAEVDNNEARAMLLESTAIKTFLPNHAAQGEQIRKLYSALGLNERQIEIIANGVPHRDYLCVTDLGSRLFRLDLGPIARALCASTGSDDVALAHHVLADAGQSGFLDEWLAAKGLGPAPDAHPPPAMPCATEIIHANGRVNHADL
jgi:type IV secretion system protein VirB4